MISQTQITRTDIARPQITRAQSWILRIVVALVAASFFGNALYALVTWLHTMGS
ncbi:MAG TPA: hypothetical protein VMB81_21645 [Candidatus Sulfotelmatobacter sp.]|nr:hypothetical protein [Candidatus Sulfotelmatobacter sp.]